MTDPRVRLSIVVMTLQLLGQTVLGFNVSIAQIALALGSCAVIDLAITFWRTRRFVWPASAILTGNGVAFILRVAGTRHGDWLSLNGAGIFVGTAAVAILSKHLVRIDGRHLFNPANLGLVLCFLLVGAPRVFPQYLWWGPLGPAVIVAWAVILAGAVWILRPLRMFGMVATFAIPFSVAVAVLAAGGSCFEATWRADSVCGLNYWIGIALSPEVAIFVLFMMSDPRTSPRTMTGRVLYGGLVSLVAIGLLSVQPTEYGIKVAILAALVVVCPFVPVLERLGPARNRRREEGGDPARAAALGVLVAFALSVGVLGLSADPRLLKLERGGTIGGGPSQ